MNVICTVLWKKRRVVGSNGWMLNEGSVDKQIDNLLLNKSERGRLRTINDYFNGYCVLLPEWELCCQKRELPLSRILSIAVVAPATLTATTI